MHKYIYLNLVALLILGLIIWTVNGLFKDMIKTSLSEIRDLKEESYLKQAFVEQGDPSVLSKKINDFATVGLDKGKFTESVAQMANEASVAILSVDIKEVRPVISDLIDSEAVDINDVDTVQTEKTRQNTFKQAEIIIKLSGSKVGMDAFIEKLVNSSQYIDIQTISLDITKGNGSIKSIIYYTNI